MSQPPPASPYTGAPEPMSPQDEKLWATLTHVGGILFNWIAPLIAYLLLRDRGPFIAQHATAALNFQLTITIALIVGAVTSWLGIGLLIMLAAYVVMVIFSIMAAMAANRGEYYTYPLAITFVR